jgi:sugar phosphate isomerase/epimerase
MQINRRTFLGQVAAGTLMSSATGRAAEIKRLGLQLYTVRNVMAKDFEGTLAVVAAAGYKEVEFAGYYDKSPSEVRTLLDRYKLTSPSAHVDYATLDKNLPKVIADCQTIGHTYIVDPFVSDEMRKDPDVWQKLADAFNRFGEATKKAGIQFAYHNHHFEFVSAGGKRPIDILLDSCDPNLVKFEMDLFWTTVAGEDPLSFFKKYPGRFPMVHVKGLKDRLPKAETTFIPFQEVFPHLTDVGTSDVIEWKRIFAQSKQAGIRHYFVEHDQPASPFDSIRASAKYLDALRF